MEVVEYLPDPPMMPLDSVWIRVRRGVAQAIATQNLPGISKVFALNVIDEAAIEAPCLVVCLEEGIEETDAEGTTFEEDGTTFPVNVFLVDAGSPVQHERGPQWLGWRRQVRRYLHSLIALPGVPECWDVRVKPMRAITGTAKDQHFEWQAGGLVARCFCCEPKLRPDVATGR